MSADSELRFIRGCTVTDEPPATSGNIAEGTRALTGVVTLGPGTSVAVDCTNIRNGLATCAITIVATALGPAPVVTSGVAVYQRTALSGGRVRHELAMVGLRPVRLGPFVVRLPYLLQVSVVDGA